MDSKAAYFYATELTAGTFSKSYCLVYATELTAPNYRKPDGYFYATEATKAIVSVQNALFYTYDNTVNQPNPTQLKRWDGTQWVRSPYYVWNGTGWVQVT